ncbi:MAG: reverse transcriptase family protein [Sedimenticola sp.]
MGTRRRNNKSYPIHQCALYKLRNKRKLASILGLPLPKLLRLVKLGDRNYHQFEINPAGRKPRPVQHPKARLEQIHARLFELLRRVTPPAYLHSGIKGRSYVTNAKSHLGEHPVCKLDIKSFYPSTTYQHVSQFFRDTLSCSPDVAAILTSLTTVNGHLPTGSCLSQILAFYSHVEMFNKIHNAASDLGITMTCYVDDITCSGEGVTPGFLFEIKKIIHKRGLTYHKERIYRSDEPKLITGVIINKDEARVPNKLQRVIHEGIDELAASTVDDLRSLAGKCNAAAQIEPHFLGIASRVRGYKPGA